MKSKAHSAYRSHPRTEEVVLRALAHLKGHMRCGTKTSTSPEGWMEVVLVISSGERPDWGLNLKTKAHSAYRSHLHTEEVMLQALAHLKGHMRCGTKTSTSPEGWIKVVLVISPGKRPDCGLKMHAFAHCANRSDPPVEEKMSRASARTREHYV